MYLHPNVTGRGPKSVQNVAPLPPDVALAYRVNDAARVSGLSRSTINKLISAGKLRSIMVAGRRLIPTDALRALLSAA
jgi:excisionase family DNA binding protein